MFRAPMVAGTESTKARMLLGEIRALQREYNGKIDAKIVELTEMLSLSEQRSRTASNQTKRKPATRIEVIEFAKEYILEKKLTFKGRIKFSVDKMEGSVTCVIGYRMGVAYCSPGEIFNVHIGEAIALSRALDTLTPPELQHVPNPSILAKGTVVRAIHSTKEYTIVCRNESHDSVRLGKAYTVRETGMRGWLGDKQFTVIDDSDAEYGVKEWPYL